MFGSIQVATTAGTFNAGGTYTASGENATIVVAYKSSEIEGDSSSFKKNCVLGSWWLKSTTSACKPPMK
jgi:hypothetical protein